MKQYSFLDEEFLLQTCPIIEGLIPESIKTAVGNFGNKVMHYTADKIIKANKALNTPKILLKSPTARKIYRAETKFLNSKYAFPAIMNLYGLGTIQLPSGSMYAIGLGLLPQDLRKQVIRQIRHAKTPDELLKIKDFLFEYGTKKYEGIKDLVLRGGLPADLNITKGIRTPEMYVPELQRTLYTNISNAVSNVRNSNPSVRLVS